MTSKKTIEETYQKKTHKEQILLRPDSYIGDNEKSDNEIWCLGEEKTMIKKVLSYAPGLYKIFDEILVNSCDNNERLKLLKNDKTIEQMTELKVKINKEKNEISVYNDGKGIEIVLHKEHNVYVPELIFGHLLTSSNYDDDEEKTTGGRNGYGAKLTNIFSEKFVVETANADLEKKYKQVFKDNMSVIKKPKIEKYKGKSYTKITFTPDLEKFEMKELEDDIITLMEKRVYDLTACCPDISIYLNGKKLAINSFEKYVNLYIGSDKKTIPRAYEKVNDRWEICVCLSPDDKMEQVSFVNSINTLRGGKHVDMIANQIAKKMIIKTEKKGKKGKKGKKEDTKSLIKPANIKDNLWIFLNSTIINPSFDSQTKETLKTQVSKFGSVCDLSDKFINAVCKTGVLEKAQMLSNYKSKSSLSKADGKKTNRIFGIPKLDDANWAGTKKSSQCTLILTEGDSAKALAIAGLSVVGRDKFGVYPLKGKLLNVRGATVKQEQNTKEINELKKILGLQRFEAGTNKPKVYKDLSELRYGHVLFFCDADADGSHIKGLGINIFHYYWPSLSQFPEFLQCFTTPIIKAKKGKKEFEFNTLVKYNDWKLENNDGIGWNIKYYKGLATSSAKEAKEYFKDYESKVISYCRNSKADDTAIELAFNDKKANARKQWIADYDEDDIIDEEKRTISYKTFVDKELRIFSVASNVRSIPSLCDGLKPSHRKIIFSVFKRNLKNDIKVSQLAGYISEQSAYHHGEASLQSTILGLAQNFVGSNNINLLYPSGQFGTRLGGGKDGGAARYIFTRMSSILPLLFKKEDEPLLNFLSEEGQSIEPEWYLPILPLILINGSSGIGTGYSTLIPQHNPLDIIDKIYSLMEDEKEEKDFDNSILTPWYNGFTGEILKDNKGKFRTEGIFKIIKKDIVEISELPIGSWTNDYIHNTLEKKISDNKPMLKNYVNNGTDVSVKLTLHFNKNCLEMDNFKSDFGMCDTKNTCMTNLTLFDKNGKIKKYKNTNEILKEFYEVRLKYYVLRRKYLKKKLKEELQEISEKVRFIWAVVKEEIVVFNKSDDDINSQLETLKFKQKDDSYDYLIGMPLRSLTEKKIKELEKQKDKKTGEYKIIKKSTPKGLWKDDIKAFKAEYIKNYIF